jgi:hypothetical protein
MKIRQVKLDASAPMGGRGGGYPSTVSLGDRPHDRKPQAGATGSTITSRIGAMEAIKYTLALVGSNPRPVVFDHEPEPAAAKVLHAQTNDPLALIGVLNRIANQVSQRLGEAVRVRPENPLRRRPKLEVAARGEGHPIPQARNVVDQLNRLDAQELRLLGLCEQEQVVDKS